MAMPNDEEAYQRLPHGGDRNLPVPDPTRLTTDQLRRELGAVRELLETRMDAVDKATDLRLAEVRELFKQFDGLPAQMREAIQDRALQHEVLVDEQLKRIEQGIELQFDGVAKQFAERDIRTDQASRASKEALDAALLAAKELVGVTNDNTTKQVDQITTLIATNNQATDARITELKERIDRGGSGGFEEGMRSARVDVNTHKQTSTASLMAAIGIATVVISFVILVTNVLLAG